ncbi:MAG: hypothetical protein V4637_10065, partial [Pseudomonadota bacterium]
GGKVRRLGTSELDEDTLHALLARRGGAKPLKPYLRQATERERQLLERSRAQLERDSTSALQH